MTAITVYLLLVGIGLQVHCVRGRAFHNLLVERVAEDFRAAGFRARIEHPIRLPNARTDFLDVLADRGPRIVACEIETTPRYAAINAEKARMLNLPLLFVVPTRALGRVIARRVELATFTPTSGRTWILLPDEVGQRLSEFLELVFPGESSTKGNQK